MDDSGGRKTAMGRPYLEDVKVLFEQLMIQMGSGADQEFVRDVIRPQFGMLDCPFVQAASNHCGTISICSECFAEWGTSLQCAPLVSLPTGHPHGVLVSCTLLLLVAGAELPRAVHAVAKQCGLDWDLEAPASHSEPESPSKEASANGEGVAEHNPVALTRTGSSRRKGITPARIQRGSSMHRSESMAR